MRANPKTNLLSIKDFKYWIIVIIFLSQLAISQVPTISPSVVDQSDFPGTQICVDMPLINTGPPGYGPYLQLIVPAGLTFNSATLFGSAVTSINEGVFPAGPGNQLTDSIINQQITGPEGDTLILLQPPIGSVVAGGPPLNINICYTINVTAPVNVPLTISATPVYEFGDTPTGDNGPILGAADAFDTTPILVRFRKEDSAPENERPPGPSWPVTYVLTADIASNNTIDNIVIVDTLPTNFVLTASSVVPSIAPNCTITTGATLTVNCNAITGTNVDDVVVTYTGYYNDVLDESICNINSATNTATFDGEFASNAIPQLTDSRTIQIEHISMQKGASPNNNLSPGDVVTFTLNLQITDFGVANSIQLQDILPDGYTFNAASETASFGSITAAITNNTPSNGATTLDFDVTTANGGNFAAGTAITITYTATIDALYFNAQPLLASDTLTNTITNTYGLTVGSVACTDGSAATVDIKPVVIHKELLTTGPYVPGQTVTYRLSMEVPSGDTRNVVFKDFFPLPVFEVGGIDLTTPIIPTGTNPDIRLATNPPSISHIDTLGLNPTSIAVNAAENSLTINWPDITTASAQTLSVDVDVKVTTKPFADNLSLSNLLQVSTDNTAATTATGVTPVLIQVRAPRLDVTKGVILADQGIITPVVGTPPEDGDIDGIDAGDSITYQITIENQGGAIADNVVISDPAIPQLSACAIVSVLDGTGAPLATTGSLATGLSLTNPLAANDGTVGAPYGADTALVTYSCTITVVPAGATFTNTASVVFSSVGGGATPFPAATDTATATVFDPSVVKTVFSTAPNADADNTTVTIGETIQYQVVMTIPEGVTPSSSLVDTLDAGLVFQSIDSITPSSAAVNTTHLGGFAAVQTAAAAGVGTSTTTFPFDDIVNSNTANGTTETITILYTVLVQDVVGNTNGGLRNNSAVLAYTVSVNQTTL